MNKNTAPTAPLYTELPYPADGVVRTTVAKTLRKGLEEHAPSLLRRDGLWLADIGCGTGEATVGIALHFPKMNVVGIDINPASLEKAQALAREHKANVTFVLGDIASGIWETVEEAGVLPEGKKFAVAVSMGVLHHLSEPQTGFAEARRILNDDGMFLCFVYSILGRWDDIAARAILDRAVPDDASYARRAEALRLLNVSQKHSFWDSVKSFRKRLKHGPPLAPLELMKVYFARTGLVHISDTFSNPCEHLFYFSDLMEIFDKTGWSFVSLAEQGGLPTKPERHTSDPKALQLLRTLPPDVLYDYFAYFYRAWGFTFFLRPAKVGGR